jgi:hypothetical protein
VVLFIVERLTEHMPTVFAATMDHWRLAGLTDNPGAMASACRANVSRRWSLHERP